MGFEVFQKTSAPLGKSPSVTLQKTGILSFNRSAMALIGTPGFVELLWDPERSVVGVRGCEESNPNAYIARAQNLKEDKGPILVAASTFASFYKLDTSVSRRWAPYLEDDILCINLAELGHPVVSNRTRRAEVGAET